MSWIEAVDMCLSSELVPISRRAPVQLSHQGIINDGKYRDLTLGLFFCFSLVSSNFFFPFRWVWEIASTKRYELLENSLIRAIMIRVS